MGQTLSEPEVTKHTTYGEDDRLLFAVSEMQGWRLSMEDAHATILDLDNTDESAAAQCGKGKKGKHSFFAVYDGHGGSTVARYSGDTVHRRLRDLPEYQEEKWQDGMRRVFLKTDEDLRKNPDYAHDTSGCTAVATLILEDNTIICANAGDSRSVLSVAGEAKPLSHDHKPVNKIETSRIVAAGGFVEFGRVNGNLALSRALGDFEFKQNHNLSAESQIVTADPDIIQHDPTPDDEFLIIACDGIWDVLKSQEAIDYVRRCLADRMELHQICEKMMETCLAPSSDWGGVGCDNMTVLIIALLNGRTKEEWYDWIADRVNKNIGHPTPSELPKPFANKPPMRQGGLMGAGISSPAQLLSNAINNGTLRFAASEDDDMDQDDDQYHQSPGQTDSDDSSMIEDSSEHRDEPLVPSTTGSSHVPLSSPNAPDKLEPELSPPSAVMGVVHNSPANKKSELPLSKPNATKEQQANDAEIPAPAVQGDGIMDHSENPLKG